MRPIVIVSDVHLGHRRCDDVAADLARLSALHPGHEIVLDGDTFNLSCDPKGRDPAASAASMLAAHPVLVEALRGHLASGGTLTLIAGNHDPEVQLPAVRASLLGVLTNGAEADLDVEPWFITRGPVHIEHGHLYDPGNSPTHPLVVPSPRTEPVGIELTRRFVGPYDAWELLADQWAASNADNLKRMFRHFGALAPIALLHYCGLLVFVCVKTMDRSRLTGDLALGEAALDAYSARSGVPKASLTALIEGRTRPIHFSVANTFLRFRLDGAIAALAIPAGILGGFARAGWGATAFTLGLGYLISARKNLAFRGANHMPEELRAGAALARSQTNAATVIFGHTHIEDEARGYLNLGAFGDRPHPARTYVHVDENGKGERRKLEVRS